jgi:hypothetical protein
MEVLLSGNSPSTMTAGIMLLTRARQLGFPLQVAVVGDATDLKEIPGPAVVYAPVLASCGVGRELGSGATVVIPGPPGAPVLATVDPHGVGDWFLIDRNGQGAHPATQAFLRLSRDPRISARHLGKELRRLMETLGMAPDPAVLDILFGAPVPPLLRLALALRAGRSMAGGRGDSITRHLAGSVEDAQDPLEPALTPARVRQLVASGDHLWILHRLSLGIRDRVEEWLTSALELGLEDGDRDLALVAALTEIASHLAQLPVNSILPPLGAAEDSVAVALAAALKADGDGDANRQLCQVFRFLGGRFVTSGEHAMEVSAVPPPADRTDSVALWRWFCGEVRLGRKRADALWTQVFDPLQ